MIARAKEAVTAHINREVGTNIATASTVVLENTRGKGDAKDIDSQLARARGCYGKRTWRGSTTGS